MADLDGDGLADVASATSAYGGSGVADDLEERGSLAAGRGRRSAALRRRLAGLGRDRGASTADPRPTSRCRASRATCFVLHQPRWSAGPGMVGVQRRLGRPRHGVGHRARRLRWRRPQRFRHVDRLPALDSRSGSGSTCSRTTGPGCPMRTSPRRAWPRASSTATESSTCSPAVTGPALRYTPIRGEPPDRTPASLRTTSPTWPPRCARSALVDLDGDGDLDGVSGGDLSPGDEVLRRREPAHGRHGGPVELV